MDSISKRSNQVDAIGWSVFLARCSDGTFYSDMCRTSEMANYINRLNKVGNIYYFSRYPEKLPIEVVYEDPGLPFREAFAKQRYIRVMRRVQRERLVETGQWPIGGVFRKYLHGLDMPDIFSP